MLRHASTTNVDTLGLTSTADVAYITPRMKYATKADILRAFEKKTLPKVLIASSHVLKVGLNLRRSDVMILLDPA